ncbi:MAG: glycosyltransferase family 39 protein [Armatimonadetes bacterium]|nr:glycosyltransferase family 39 protein [Armatimonadota bacterium]MDW8121101.1 glycosyltransferase family 39 protein [Armatimonadota bacterium]
MAIFLKIAEWMLFVGPLVAATVLGWGLLTRWAPPSATLGEKLLFSSSLGLGLLSYGILACGLMGWISRPVFVILLGLFFVVGFLLIRTQATGTIPFPSTHRSRTNDPSLTLSDIPFGILLFLANLLTLILCFLPPIDLRLEWDSLSYQLAFPKIYFREGEIRYIPFSHHAQFPSLMPMLYLLGLTLTNAQTVSVAKLFHWSFFLIVQACLFLWGATQPKLSARSGLLAASLFAAIPVAFTEATTAYSDLALTAYVALTLYCLSRYDGDFRWLILSGACAGFAAATKYTGLFAIGLLMVLGFLVVLPNIGRGFIQVLMGMVLAVLVASPWYVKNWLWTGNPVFPFAYSLFGGKNWSGELARNYDLSNKEFGAGRDLSSAALSFVSLTFNEVRKSPCARQWLRLCSQKGDCTSQWKCGHFENQDIPEISLGPFFLIFVPPFFLLISRNLSLSLIVPAGGLLIWFGWWFWEAQYLRYLLPALALSCVLAGFVADQLIRSGRLIAGITRFIALATIAYGLLFLTARTATWGTVALGLLDPTELQRLTDQTIPGSEVLRIIRHLPRRSVIACYGYPFGFFIDRPYYWADPGHNRLIEYEKVKTVKDLIAEWSKRGTDYVMINWRFVKDQRFAGWIQDGVRQGLLEVIGRDGEVELLKVQKGG